MIADRSNVLKFETPTQEEDAEIRRWAAHALAEMDKVSVPPTPRNFMLWFTHLSGANPALTRHIAALPDAPLLPDAVAALHASFPLATEMDQAVADQATELDDAARAMVDDVASNREHLVQYGAMLTAWTSHVGDHRTLDSLLKAVATLTTETARAAERNISLEQALSASSARINQLKDSLAEVKRGATTDMLTGLPNRKALLTKLRRALQGAKSDGTAVSVLMLDVDHFKGVNDSYGHQAGDLVLRLIGRLLSESVKGRDTSARYGGEEFAVLLVGADLQAAATVGDQIRRSLEGKRLIARRWVEETGTVTISVGVAQFQPGDTTTTLLERADVALYRAKNLGRNRVCTG